jgi:nucleoside 2-deoxyribosyltransferase
MKRCYLAGPDVFHPGVTDLAAGKRALCKRYGLTGCFPLDNEADLSALDGRSAAMAIYQANIRLIDSCDMLIANLTPFRGVSADAGTVFELGYMTALGRPVAAYSLDPRIYLDRVVDAGWAELPAATDQDGQMVEDFGLADNLMLAGALQATDRGQLGDNWIFSPGDWRQVDDHLRAFELCLQRVAKA